MHSVMPKSIGHLDCPELRIGIRKASEIASENWNCSSQSATEEVLRRLADDLVARRSLSAALRCLRDIPEQDPGETV